MDSDGDRSLPGMSLPKWMRRTTERYDYTDICSSPPINPDGFFHMKLRHQKPSAGQSVNNEASAPCLQIQKRREDPPVERPQHFDTMFVDMDRNNWTSSSNASRTGCIQLQRHASDNDCSSITPEPSAIYKAVSTSSLVTKPKSETTIVSHCESQLQISTKPHVDSAVCIDSRDSKGFEEATTNFDVMGLGVVHTNNPSVIITKSDDGECLFGIVEKKLVSRSKSVPCTPDITPVATPAVTPSSSPQMGRRTGNPFFTGSTNSSGTGSWLFRPAQQDTGYSGDREKDTNRSTILYETKVDVQINPNTKAIKKNVRLVPRPSELRELNFWSPTSM